MNADFRKIHSNFTNPLKTKTSGRNNNNERTNIDRLSEIALKKSIAKRWHQQCDEDAPNQQKKKTKTKTENEIKN